MSYASDRITAIDAELARREAGGYVESYSEGGTSITSVPYETLLEWREKFGRVVDRESGKRRNVILARLQPR